MIRKKIIIAISKLYGGGAEKVAILWANTLVKRGYDVYLFIVARGINEYEVDNGVKIVTASESLEKYLKLSSIEKYIMRRRQIKNIGADIIISFLPNYQIQMGLLTIGMKIKRIETIRVNPWMAGNSETERRLWKLCFRRSDFIIVQSEDQKEFLRKKDLEKTHIIRNPISDGYIAEPNYIYRQNPRQLIAVGRICDQKNYLMLIDAIQIIKEKIPDISLKIYGTGGQAEISQLENRIEKLQLIGTVELCGQTSAIRDKYLDADLFIMTSNFEGMPNALAEAMALGLPCISTNCKTGPKDMIDHGVNGFLIETGDVLQLAETIQHALSMPNEERKLMGNRARTKILELCNNESNMNRLIELIESV